MARQLISKWLSGYPDELIALLYREYQSTQGHEVISLTSEETVEAGTYPRLSLRTPSHATPWSAHKTLHDVEQDVLKMMEKDISVISKRDCSGRAAIHLICSLHSPGQLNILKALCSYESSTQIQDSMCRTALHHALSPQNLLYHSEGDGKTLVDIIQILIENGAKVNVSDCDEITPLHLALDYYRSLKTLQIETLREILCSLKDAGADLNINAPSIIPGGTYNPSTPPLHLAVRLSGQNGIDAINLFIDPLSVHALDHCLRTPLHVAISSVGSCKKCIQRDGINLPPESESVEEKVLLLLSYKAEINAQDSDEVTPLALAVELFNYQCCVPLVKLLMRNGANGKLRDGARRTIPLHIICRYFDEKLRELLPLFLEAGGRLNVRDAQLRTPFHYSLKNPACRWETLKLLVESGADPTLTDEGFNGAIHMLCDSPQPHFESAVAFLQNAGCDINHKNSQGNTPLLHLLMSQYNKHSMQTLIKLGADCCAQNKESMSALHLVSRSLVYHSDVEEIVEVLIQGRADVNCQECSGNTPLHYAVKDESTTNVKAIRKLLIAGANPNIKNKLGMTPLHIVTSYCNEHLAKLLLDYGADPNAFDIDGSTPLHIVQAAKTSSMPTARVLINYGANLGAKNNSNATPFVLMSRTTCKYMIPYTVLLLSAGKYSLSPQENELLDRCKLFFNLYSACLSCVNSMKTRLLGKSTVTLLEFLLSTNERAMRYVRNPEILNDLVYLSKGRKYHWYLTLLEAKLDDAVFLKTLHERTTNSLNIIAPFELPEDVTDLILSYLDEFDMNSINRAVLVLNNNNEGLK